jgi:hypothetical protein
VDSFNNGIHWPCDNNKRTTQFMWIEILWVL